jgi:hypothetical protein
MTGIVTDTDLARARQDPSYRHQLVAAHLDLLLRALNTLRRASPDAAQEDQMREGIALAVKLADLLRRIAGAGPDSARAA